MLNSFQRKNIDSRNSFFSPSTRQEMVTGGVKNRERKLIPQKAFF
jgi:hypothetical protein